MPVPVPTFSGDNQPSGLHWGRHPDEYRGRRDNSIKRRDEKEEPPAGPNFGL